MPRETRNLGLEIKVLGRGRAWAQALREWAYIQLCTATLEAGLLDLCCSAVLVALLVLLNLIKW